MPGRPRVQARVWLAAETVDKADVLGERFGVTRSVVLGEAVERGLRAAESALRRAARSAVRETARADGGVGEAGK